MKRTFILVLCLLVISLTNFNLTTPSAAQPKPQPKQLLPPEPCYLHQRAQVCKTQDGKTGFQEQVCENKTWVDVGACVPLMLPKCRPGMLCPPLVTQCKSGTSRGIYCEKGGKFGFGSELCVSGRWIVIMECRFLEEQPRIE